MKKKPLKFDARAIGDASRKGAFLGLFLLASAGLDAGSAAAMGDGIRLFDGAKTESVTEFSVPVLGGESFGIERSYSSNQASQLGPLGYGWDISLPENSLVLLDTADGSAQCDPRCFPDGRCEWREAKYKNVLFTIIPTPEPVTRTPSVVQCCESGCVEGLIGDVLCGASLRAAYLKGPRGQAYRFVSQLGSAGQTGIFGSGHWVSYYQSDPGPLGPKSCTGNPPTRELSYGLPATLMENTDTGEMRLVNNDGTYQKFGNAPLRDAGHPSSYVGLSLLAMVDRNGNQTLIERVALGGGGQKTIVHSPGGRDTEITHDAIGLVTGIKDPMGRTYRYTYNSLTELVSVDGPGPDSANPGSGYHAAYTYGANHLMLTKDDAKSGGLKAARYDYASNSVSAVYDGINRRRFTFEYLDGGRTRVTLGRGQAYDYSFDEQGKATRIQLPDRTEILNVYDSQANLITRTVKPADGSPARTWAMAYDDRHNLIFRKDPEGKSESWVYASAMPACGCDRFAQSYTDKRGNTAHYGHDSFGNLTSSTDTEGYTTRHSYDSYGQRQSTTDARGKVTSYDYNSTGDLSAIHSPAGDVSYGYDLLGRVTSVQDELGHTTSYALDGFGNALTTTFADNSFISCHYDGHSNQTSCTLQTAQGQSPLGQTSYQFDAADQLLQVTDAESHVTGFSYDEDGLRRFVTDPNNHAWETAYDMLGRVRMTSDPMGHSTTLTLDAYGNRSEVMDAEGNITRYSYDKLDRLRFMTDARNATIEFRYDNNGNRRFMIDANNHETEWQYDKRNLLSAEIDAKGVYVKEYTYDENGNVASLNDGKNVTTSYVYDDANRLVTESPGGGTGYAYTYGSAAHPGKGYNLFTVSDPRGIETFSYDALDRLVTQAKPGGEQIANLYDARGNRIQSTLSFRPGSPLAPVQQTWAFDKANRNISAVDFAGKTKTLAYDPASRLTAEGLPGQVSVRYSYDTANRLLDLKNLDKHSSAISSSHYELDRVGNRLSKTDIRGRISYSYDKTYQLTGVRNPEADLPNDSVHRLLDGLTKTVSIAYDPLGNRTNYSETYTGAQPSLTKTYAHNAANEMTNAGGVIQTYDENGNLKTSGPETLSWDHRNRLISSIASGKPDWTATYSYDNHINSRYVGTTQTAFIYDDKGRLLAELDVDGKPNVVYSYDAIGVYAETKFFGASSRPSTDYYLFDALGSVMTVTDSTGRSVHNYDYGAFGEEYGGQRADKWNSHFRYTGRWGGFSDERVGVINWNRPYSPNAGRWLSRDPIGTAGGLNLYRYVTNNPTNAYDPSGLEPCPDCAKAPPLPADSSACDKYGNQKYAPYALMPAVSLKCFCKCAGNSKWSQNVRGCLACEFSKGTDIGQAHTKCYAASGGLGSSPLGELSSCYASCLFH